MKYISATRTNSDKYQTRHISADNRNRAHEYDSAFCLNRSNFQPLNSSYSNLHNSIFISNTPLFQSNIIKLPQGLSPKVNSINSLQSKNILHLPQGYQTINVTTRNRPKVNTFEQKIPKRKRAPNKKIKMNKDKITIATQTEDNNNKGLGRTVIRPDTQNPIYPLANSTDMPQYRKILSQVFGEEFVAEATQKD